MLACMATSARTGVRDGEGTELGESSGEYVLEATEGVKGPLPR